ncbi:unnamed protein product [Mesocestoides corti]|uniref:Uncharacterized protein n=1 Tax=Mesocestoides corti TaxID=53468 RepID=A0A0R3U605_MESCO|nr:unnamed protein product [Mesocestoides corti]
MYHHGLPALSTNVPFLPGSRENKYNQTPTSSKDCFVSFCNQRDEIPPRFWPWPRNQESQVRHLGKQLLEPNCASEVSHHHRHERCSDPNSYHQEPHLNQRLTPYLKTQTRLENVPGLLYSFQSEDGQISPVASSSKIFSYQGDLLACRFGSSSVSSSNLVHANKENLRLIRQAINMRNSIQPETERLKNAKSPDSFIDELTKTWSPSPKARTPSPIASHLGEVIPRKNGVTKSAAMQTENTPFSLQNRSLGYDSKCLSPVYLSSNLSGIHVETGDPLVQTSKKNEQLLFKNLHISIRNED